jgi:hypothetical protein
MGILSIISSTISSTKAVFILSAVLVALIFGVYRVFTLPTEIEEQVTVFNYEHMGEFDYLAHQKASYLFDNIPPEAIGTNPINQPANPKYPVEFIESIDFNFSYHFVADKPIKGISEQ